MDNASAVGKRAAADNDRKTASMRRFAALSLRQRLLLLTTEDTFSGAWTSRLWYCRTYNREELMRLCAELGLLWKQELWFTRMHKAMRAGGICVEIQKP